MRVFCVSVRLDVLINPDRGSCTVPKTGTTRQAYNIVARSREHCCHGNALMISLCPTVEIQNIQYCSQLHQCILRS